jgi:gliding motility-associated-like protein
VITLKEIKVITLFIPEGFSPNADGAHDYFVLGNTDGYTNITFKVFNRWGSLVYENNDYRGPEWWDGSSNNGLTIGEKLPDGTYFYEIRTNKGEKYVNYFTLKR